jgi:hypothetical protein
VPDPIPTTPEPETEAGRQHVAEFDVGQYGRVRRAVLAIEHQAAERAVAAERERVRAAMERLSSHTHGTMSDWLVRRAVLAIISGEEPT